MKNTVNTVEIIDIPLVHYCITMSSTVYIYTWLPEKPTPEKDTRRKDHKGFQMRGITASRNSKFS